MTQVCLPSEVKGFHLMDMAIAVTLQNIHVQEDAIPQVTRHLVYVLVPKDICKPAYNHGVVRVNVY